MRHSCSRELVSLDVLSVFPLGEFMSVRTRQKKSKARFTVLSSTPCRMLNAPRACLSRYFGVYMAYGFCTDTVAYRRSGNLALDST